MKNDWEKELNTDIELLYQFFNSDMVCTDYEGLKKYISSILTHQRREIAERLRKCKFPIYSTSAGYKSLNGYSYYSKDLDQLIADLEGERG